MNNLTNNLVAFIGWHEGSAGVIHSWFEKSCSLKIACFVHPSDSPPQVIKINRSASQFSYPEDSKFKNLPLICSEDWTNSIKNLGIRKVLITTPNSCERHDEIAKAKLAGLELINAIHPTALILADAILGRNIIMHARSFLGYRAELGDGVILNSGAQIDHHCVLGECVTIDPAVVMAGNVYVQHRCTIHTAAVIKNKITIKQGSVVGAGAVVIKDVGENETVVGVPARPLKKDRTKS